MKTTTEYQLKEKKRKLYVPSIKKLNINLYDEMSEKLKVKQFYTFIQHKAQSTWGLLLSLCFEGNMCECLCFPADWVDYYYLGVPGVSAAVGHV